MPRRGRGLQRRQRGDTGAVSLELALIMPVLLLIIYLMIQGALWFHARNVASSAAQEGLRDARAEHSTVAAGIATARGFISKAGGSDVLVGAQVTGSRTETQATVTVSGRAVSILGLFDLSVRQSASGAVERYTGPPGT